MRDPQVDVGVESRLEEADREISRLTEQNEAYRLALVAILNHGETHEYPCHALHKGDCADAMQEYARTALWTPAKPDSYPET